MFEPRKKPIFTKNTNNEIGKCTTSTTNLNQIPVSPQNSQVTSMIIEGGKWVFFSNRLVAYWPFSIKSTSSNHISHKHLNFQFPTVSLFLSVSYLLLNVLYLFHYFFVKFQDDVRDFHPFDLILITTWDCMIMFGVIGYRIYGILRLSKFHSFWNNIVNLVTQISKTSSKRETKEKFRQLNRWGLKWIVIFTLMGLLNATAVFYNYVYITHELPQVVITFEYLESVIMMHNSSAFLLVFFLKIITHGFTTCHRKLEQMSEENVQENYSEKSCDCVTIELTKVFNLIHKLEECVSSFNSTFVFTLLLEAVFSFLQVMFALYFVHVVDPVSNAAYWINMAMPIFMYSGLSSQFVRCFEPVNVRMRGDDKPSCVKTSSESTSNSSIPVVLYSGISSWFGAEYFSHLLPRISSNATAQQGRWEH
ncbi:unnamed protein product [Orchesella dallaii]|uniref:Gustatory receptor n=1 Tax=Orchesella dallaii TaxID=48710 RepID=A0ABP1PWP8_9HEXA